MTIEMRETTDGWNDSGDSLFRADSLSVSENPEKRLRDRRRGLAPSESIKQASRREYARKYRLSLMPELETTPGPVALQDTDSVDNDTSDSGMVDNDPLPVATSVSQRTSATMGPSVSVTTLNSTGSRPVSVRNIDEASPKRPARFVKPADTTENKTHITPVPSDMQTVQALLDLYNRKVYHEGYLFQLQELSANGKGMHTDGWRKAYVELCGVRMTVWDADSSVTAESIIPLYYINLTDSQVHLHDDTPPGRYPPVFEFSINSAGKNRIRFKATDTETRRAWVIAIQLSCFECARFQKIYTMRLISRRLFADILQKPPSGKIEGLLSVRLPGKTEWQEHWTVLEAQREKKLFRKKAAQVKNCFMLYHSKKAKHDAVKIDNVKAVYAVYPNLPGRIDQNTLFKVEGDVFETQHGKETLLRANASIHFMTPDTKALVRWLLAAFDVFGLHGKRPPLLNDPMNVEALNFGEPQYTNNLSHSLVELDDVLFVASSGETMGISKEEFDSALRSRMMSIASQKHRRPSDSTRTALSMPVIPHAPVPSQSSSTHELSDWSNGYAPLGTAAAAGTLERQDLNAIPPTVVEPTNAPARESFKCEITTFSNAPKSSAHDSNTWRIALSSESHTSVHPVVDTENVTKALNDMTITQLPSTTSAAVATTATATTATLAATGATGATGASIAAAAPIFTITSSQNQKTKTPENAARQSQAGKATGGFVYVVEPKSSPYGSTTSLANMQPPSDPARASRVSVLNNEPPSIHVPPPRESTQQRHESDYNMALGPQKRWNEQTHASFQANPIHGNTLHRHSMYNYPSFTGAQTPSCAAVHTYEPQLRESTEDSPEFSSQHSQSDASNTSRWQTQEHANNTMAHTAPTRDSQLYINAAASAYNMVHESTKIQHDNTPSSHFTASQRPIVQPPTIPQHQPLLASPYNASDSSLSAIPTITDSGLNSMMQVPAIPSVSDARKPNMAMMYMMQPTFGTYNRSQRQSLPPMQQQQQQSTTAAMWNNFNLMHGDNKYLQEETDDHNVRHSWQPPPLGSNSSASFSSRPASSGYRPNYNHHNSGYT